MQESTRKHTSLLSHYLTGVGWVEGDTTLLSLGNFPPETQHNINQNVVFRECAPLSPPIFA